MITIICVVNFSKQGKTGPDGQDGFETVKKVMVTPDKPEPKKVGKPKKK